MLLSWRWSGGPIANKLEKNQAYANSSQQPSNARHEGDEEQLAPESTEKTICCKCPFPKNCFNSQNNTTSRTSTTSVLTAYLSRPSRASTRRLEEISKRAAAYVIGFVLSYIFTVIYRIVEAYGPESTAGVPFTITLLSRTFFPLKGIINVLVYTYPHVTSYRRNHVECNWLQAFWNVVRTGGDSDQIRVGRTNRRGSIRKRQRVLEQSGFRGRNEVEGIMPIDGE